MKIKEGVIPKDFQQEGIEFMLQNRYVILADEMGLGKTFQAIMVAAITGKRTMICCPANLRFNWVKELHKFLEDFTYLVISEKKDLDKVTYEENFIICSYYQIKNISFILELTQVWIFDEAHFYKNPKSQRTQFILGYVSTSSRPDYLLLLTGTPVTNRIPDFWTLLYLTSYYLDGRVNMREVFPNWYKFSQYFCEVDEMQLKIKGRPRRITKYGKMKKDKLPTLKKLLHKRFIRRLAKDHLDLEGLYRKNIKLKDSVNEKLLEAYQNPEKVHSMEIKEKNAYFKSVYTVPYALQLHEEILSPVLIYTDHVGSAQNLTVKLREKKAKVAIISGTISQARRKEIVDRFQNNELDFLVATIGTSATGYTFVNCNNIIFNDYSWNPADNIQAEKRIHRIGQTKPCYIHRVLGDATDEHILNLVEEKQTDIEMALKEKK